jgi:hypothetical protein
MRRGVILLQHVVDTVCGMNRSIVIAADQLGISCRIERSINALNEEDPSV